MQEGLEESAQVRLGFEGSLLEHRVQVATKGTAASAARGVAGRHRLLPEFLTSRTHQLSCTWSPGNATVSGTHSLGHGEPYTSPTMPAVMAAVAGK